MMGEWAYPAIQAFVFHLRNTNADRPECPGCPVPYPLQAPVQSVPSRSMCFVVRSNSKSKPIPSHSQSTHHFALQALENYHFRQSATFRIFCLLRWKFFAFFLPLM